MRVSVCIPTYNQVLYIEKAVRSVADQSIPPFEIIVSDDCSTDDTPKILKRLSEEIPILKVISQPVNMGISRNVDACLRAATGDYVLRLDSDDFIFPDFIEKISAGLDKHPSAGYAHAAVQEVDQFDKPLKQRKLARASGLQSPEDALKAAVYGYRVAANILMFRREALEKADYIAAKSNFAEDYYLCASIAANGYGNYYLNEILSSYRVWVDAGNVRQRRKLAEIIGLRKVFEEVLEPGFKARNWNTAILTRKRTDFACRHADCLGWAEYNSAEKEELKQELYRLSDARRTKLVAGMYVKGYGGILNKLKKILSLPKSVLKSLILHVKN